MFEKEELTQLNTFEVMQNTTQNVLNQVKERYGQLNTLYSPEVLKGCALLMFGSGRRGELVPHSDADFVFISTEEAERAGVRPTLLGLMETIPEFDKNDTPHWRTLTELNENAISKTQEAEYSDVIPVAGDDYIWKQYLESGIREYFLNPRFVADKLIWGDLDLRHQYRQKQIPEGTNLKYSEGGSRDILSFDRLCDYVMGKKGRERIGHEKIPQIQYTLGNIIPELEEFSNPEDGISVREAIDYVVYIKYSVLELNKDTSSKGKGFMNNETASRILKAFPQKHKYLNIGSPEELIRYYNMCRLVIYRSKSKVHKAVVRGETRERGKKWGEAYKHAQKTREFDATLLNDELTGVVHLYSNNTNRSFTAEASKFLVNSTNYRLLSALLSSPFVDSSLLHSISQYQAQLPYLDYLNRIIIKHPNTSTETLNIMASSERLALDNAVSERYRQMAINRVERN